MDSKTNPKTTSSTLEILEAMRRNSEENRSLNKALAKNLLQSLSSLPPTKQSKRPTTAQEFVDYYDERRGLNKLDGPRWPVGRSYPKNPNLPWNQKAPNAPHPDLIKLASLKEDLRHLELPPDARSIVLAYRYKDKANTGIYAINEKTSGIELEVELEACSLRHFQVQMLQGILGDMAPVGNLVVFCEDLSLVEHFHPARWNYYRANDWKEPSGDKLRFRVLYEQLGEAMKGRTVIVTFPEPNLPEVEKLTQRINATRKQ